MTPATLLFLRSLCDRVTLNVSDPDFRTNCHQMIAVLDELDKEIADAGNTSRLDTSHTGDP